MTTTVSLSTVQEVISRAMQTWPDLRERIQAAAGLIAQGGIAPTQDGSYSVKSRTQAGTSYVTSRETCSCPARTWKPQRICAHSMAVRLLALCELRQQRLDAKARRAALAAFTDDEFTRLSALRERVVAGMVTR